MSESSSKMQKVLNVYGVILIIWSIYRWKFSLPEWFDEFIAKPLVFLLPVYWYIRHSEHKDFIEDIWLRSKTLRNDCLIGISMGALFFSSAFMANIIKYGVPVPLDNLSIMTVIFVILMTLATATTEEILSRGFILKRLYEESRNVYVSSFNASLLFFVLHIPILLTIPELRGTMLLLFLATDFILSLVVSFMFLDRKSLVAPILIHAFYNLAILLYI